MAAEQRAECRRVTKRYVVGSGGAASTVTALADADAVFHAGELTVIAGPSGSGKSTLLRLLAALDRPDAGTVRVCGVDVDRCSHRARRALRREQVGYLFQQPSDNLVDYLTAREHLQLAGRLRGRPADPDQLLDTLGLGPRANHRPAQLSGGEQQRLGVAFAAAGDPALLLADEPTAQLDHAAGALVVASLRRLASTGTCVVVASHDPAVIGQADHVVRVEHGRTMPS